MHDASLYSCVAGALSGCVKTRIYGATHAERKGKKGNY